MCEESGSRLRVAVLFSQRTDLLASLSELADADPAIVLVAASTDRHHDALLIPAGFPVREAAVAYGVKVHGVTVHAALAPLERQQLCEADRLRAPPRRECRCDTGRRDRRGRR